jgi:hypothetical protein
MNVQQSMQRGGVRTVQTVVWCLAGILSVIAHERPVEATPREDATAVGADGDLSRQASWSLPSAADVRRRMLAWVGSRAADPAIDSAGVNAARELWEASDADRGDLLDAAIETFAAIDPRCVPLRDSALRPTASRPAPADWLLSATPADADPQAAFERDTVCLWLGRHLVRHDRFDEGLRMLDGLSVEEAIDPAALLFHKAACHFWLLHTDTAIDLLDRLLEQAEEIPVRYERTARLMRADIAALEDDSLDHIARRMRDITRRLDLGHAGPRTRTVQDGVIASLDKLIEKIEQQRQQSQASSGAGGSGNGGNGTPMDDSRIAGGKGPGEVQSRDLGDGEGWGDLPPHQREEALQQIGREFPPHYREAIEQYFKRLASGGEQR